MFFTRYKGVGSLYKLTPGKMYLAFEDQDNGDTVLNDCMELLDDEGKCIRFEAKSIKDTNRKDAFSNFDFFQEVYAVVTKPFGDLKKGQVVVVQEADFFIGDNKNNKDNLVWQRIIYNVKGYGYHNSNCMTLLDRTNVFPGIVILHESTGVWCKVKTVDEALWVVTECSSKRESPEAFRFAVDGDGDIQVEPYVRCIDNVNGIVSGITKGCCYRILREEQIDDPDRHMVWLVNDDWKEESYFASHFF